MKSEWIQDVTEADFDQTVLAASKKVPVLVDFWAPWCGPCRALAPVLEHVVRSFEGRVRLARLNTDENPNLSYRYGIQGIPAVKAFVDGRMADEFIGALPERRVREFVEALIPTEADRLAEQAAALEAPRPADALGLYEEALRKNPAHPSSLTGRIRVLIALNRINEARDFFNRLPGSLLFHPDTPKTKTLLDLALVRQSGQSLSELRSRVEREPENLQALWDFAVRLSAEGRYSEALENYFAILKRDRGFKNDGARKSILQIFDLIGPRSSLAETYREKLARVLF